MQIHKKKTQQFIDFKNSTVLRRHITPQGKILSKRISGLSSKQHRELTKAIKQARILGFLPFTNQV